MRHMLLSQQNGYVAVYASMKIRVSLYSITAAWTTFSPYLISFIIGPASQANHCDKVIKN